MPISEEIRQTILGDAQPITHRPADDIAPEMAQAKIDAGDLAKTDEDVLSYVMFPQPAKEYFEWREGGDGPERELVAAVVGAMFVKEASAARAQAATPDHGSNGTGPATGWRQFGRMRQMR